MSKIGERDKSQSRCVFESFSGALDNEDLFSFEVEKIYIRLLRDNEVDARRTAIYDVYIFSCENGKFPEHT